MNESRIELIEKLTGIQSSKKSYYVELKKKIAETETKNTQLQIINQLAKSINVEMSIDEILENVIGQLRQVIAFDRLSFSVMEGNRLVVASVIPKSSVVVPIGTDLPRENSLFWQLIEDKSGLVVRELTAAELTYYEEEHMRSKGIATMVCIPLLVRDKVLGILNLGRKTKGTYGKPELTFLQQLADQMAVCVENARLYAEVIRSKAELIQSAKLAAIGQMAAGVAHELNSPLTAIMGNAQLLLRKAPADSPERPLLEDINRCGTRCKKIIQNLLTFSRQEQFPFEPVNLNQVVEKVLPLVSFQIDRSNIRMSTKLHPNLPLITGNSQQIEQVLVNLLLNAKDALEGKPAKKIINITTGILPEKNPPGPTPASNTNWIYLSVSDNGQGIEEADLPNIFNPFFTTKDVGKGTGLGLSVSLGIAEAHNGTIKVESNRSKGSTFTLLLPASPTPRKEGA